MNAAVTRVAARCLARDPSELNTGWEDTLVPLGLALVGRACGDEKMLDWVRRWANYHLGADPVLEPEEGYWAQCSGDKRRGLYLTSFCGEWGIPMVLALLDPSDEGAVRLVADHICNGSMRLHDGTIAHGSWAPKPWVDTIYYTAAPLAAAYAVTKEERYAVEAVRQCLRHAEHLSDPRTGCWFHDADPATGATPDALWGRGNGWAVQALAEVLRKCPPDTEGWHEVLEWYQLLVTGLLRLQHSSGLWRIFPDVAESHLETSGSAMIAAGVAIGISTGWLDKSYAPRIRRTWYEVCTWVDDSGDLQGCQGPAGQGGWDVHKRTPIGVYTYGTGSFLRLAAEMHAIGDIQ
jgi:rhamnogalacturonyl hydrolase YesR